MRKLLLHIPVGMIGGVLYMLVEILWRGRTHWTMGVLGGVCFAGIGLLDEWKRYRPPLIVQMLLGAAIVTALELAVGLIVNVWLGWNVWDYSGMPLNFMGQICLAFSVAWVFLSFAAIKTENLLHKVERWLGSRSRKGTKWTSI